MAGGRDLITLGLVLLVVACFHGNTAQKTVCTQEAVADIVFMVDGSWSIGSENFEQIRRFLHTLINSFDVDPDHVRIGLVQYSNSPRTEFLLNTYQHKNDILDYVSKLPYMGGGTHTGDGLEFMLKNHFVASAGSRAAQKVAQIAVVITDGKSQDTVESHAQSLRRKGIVLYAIGIKDADEEQLREIANQPHSQHVYSVSDFAALQGISQNIVQTLCTTVEEAKRQLLQLSQDCAKATSADIVFLIDGSSSIGLNDFKQIRLFLKSVISGLDIGPDKVRIGLAQYSDTPQKEFYLNEHMDKAALLTQVERFQYKTGNTQTGKAIDFLRTDFFTDQAGSRAGKRVPQIAVVITDGASADDVSKPALRLRQHGVIMFGIGVGNADMKELEDIANRPLDRFRYKIENYQALQRLTVGLLKTVCVSADDQSRALAEKFADIFILVDSGGDVQQVRGFLTRMANALTIGSSAHRLGLAQYGQDVKVEFLLNAHQTKEDTQNAIKRYRPRRPQPNEPRNLGTAFREARANFFSKEAGGRAEEGYRQYLVVLSGKDSDEDSVYRESRLMKQSGVTVVGMSLGASMQQMREISSAPFYYQTVPNTPPLLRRIFDTGVKEQKNVTGECKGAKVADIVFIIDESGSIGNANYQMMREFLHDFVSGLDVSSNKVRVGIVMYNDNAEAQVYLNTFQVKDELLSYIKILPYHGGGTRTGVALKFAQENVFVTGRGSRKNRGVQQVAVVITDGESQDDVSEAATNLRRSGVTVYAVGIKSANETQLKQMASYPINKHMYNVDSFAKLQALNTILKESVCHNIIQQASTDQREKNKEGCLQTDEADIFFLIDHSGSIKYADFYDMKKFIAEFVKTFRIGEKHVRVGVVKYSDDPTLEIDLTTHSDPKQLEKAVVDIYQKGGGTETGKALKYMGPLFDKGQASRGHKVPEFLVVITDGKSSDEVKSHAERLRAQGVIIYAIGVKNSDDNELLEISGDPRKKFFVQNFDALKPIKTEIVTDICAKEVCKNVSNDVIFLVDSSGSIGDPDYQKMKEFMKNVISKAHVGQNDVRFGIMQFSTRQNLEFPLNRHYTKEAMMTAINDMRQLGGGTHTGEAIEQVSQYFEVGQGGRTNMLQTLIVITDGESQDAVKSSAARLREKNVVIYSIGVEDANTTQLQEISGTHKRMFVEKNFDGLKDLESKVSKELCNPDRGCKKVEQADIIFLVDFSKSIDDREFASMVKFMSSVVEKTTVGKDLTRFGVILYSNDPASIFSLKEYNTKKEVLGAIKGLKGLKGDTYTAKALKYSLDYFKSEWGGRKSLNVPQTLMVITDGAATDRWDLELPSKALRDEGITVLGIGVKDANKEQLEIITGDKDKVFLVSQFSELEVLEKTISPAFCASTKKRCEKQIADLVFLLDQSASIQPDDYKLLKNFTINIVNTFNVSEDRARIGLARFSTDFKDEFYLNKYYSNEAVNDQINKLMQQGGDTYIAKALVAIREYFEAAHGSRRLSGVSQNLVLITDGDAHDSGEIEEAADHLRRLGVQMFVVGIGDVFDTELLQIVGLKKRLIIVKDFKGLDLVKQTLIDTICDPTPWPPEEPGCSIDIGMGFDISQQRPGSKLIEGHAKLQNFLPDIAQYVTSIPGLCCAKADRIETKIGYAVVNRQGVVMKNMKFDGYSRDVVTKLMDMNVSEQTYFNSALLRFFAKKFTDESKGGVKVLVIFSDGLDEDVMKLEEEAERLKKSGVHALLVVALEGARDPASLQMVEFGRGFNYKLPLDVGMHSVGSTMFKQIDTVADRKCCGVLCKCSGNEGVRGGRGGPGTKGGPGQKGYPGFPGEEGMAGDRGPPGPSGPQGVQGCSGLRGPKGYRGLRGDRGEDGENGLDGVDGEQGTTGQEGGRGERGNPGNPGIPGFRGEAGVKGQRGLRGDPGAPGRSNTVPGPKGDDGNPGLPGVPGPDGPQAESGVNGPPGPDGRRGPPGAKGPPGKAGEAGLPGIPGPSGPQGPRGPRAQPGPNGIPGLPGPQGGPGPAGGKGAVGRRGNTGQKGQPGDPGDKGTPGSAGPIGMPGQDGRDGYGTDGTKGAKGDPGFPGYPGLQGEDGVKGTAGYPGRKGNFGRGGNSGRSGLPGGPGEPGRPGHAGSRGPPGITSKSECQLVTYIRDNCACSHGRSACPAFPTELVFGLDMSQDVNQAQFDRQRDALLELLKDVDISQSNCPTGARVAVIGYSSHTKHLIRFQDYRQKNQLIASIKNIALERTTNKRSLGGAMSFVGHHLFKRVRSGLMMRKVAVFFTAGPVTDTGALTTTMMEYRGLNIKSGIIALGNTNTQALTQATQLDDSGSNTFVTLKAGDMTAELSKIKNCVICYDPCAPAEACSFMQRDQSQQQVDMDLLLLLDDSREVQADQYSGVQQLLGSVVGQLSVSPTPRRQNNQARVAVVQQSAVQRVSSSSRPGFGLQTYQKQEQMLDFLLRNMSQKSGSSRLGQALDYSLTEVFNKATSPKKKVLLAVIATHTAYEDREKLRYMSHKVRCDGVATFVVTVGDRYNRTEVEDLASLPLEQHVIHVSRMKAQEQGYIQRFFRVFLNTIKRGTNTYPHPSFKRTCDQLKDIGQGQQGQGQGQIDLGDLGLEEFAEEAPERFQEQTGRRVQSAGQIDMTGALRGTHTHTATRPRLNAVCLLPGDSGVQCKPSPEEVWFFDRHLGACAPLWFGGCGGNENRFSSEPECYRACGIHNPNILPRPELSNTPSRDWCLLPQSAGDCQNYEMSWFFDSRQNQCSRFWFGGCGGNKNRFATQDDCERLCVVRI